MNEQKQRIGLTQSPKLPVWFFWDHFSNSYLLLIFFQLCTQAILERLHMHITNVCKTTCFTKKCWGIPPSPTPLLTWCARCPWRPPGACKHIHKHAPARCLTPLWKTGLGTSGCEFSFRCNDLFVNCGVNFGVNFGWILVWIFKPVFVEKMFSYWFILFWVENSH